MGRKRKCKLPRLSLLSMSTDDLERFSTAAEKVSSSVLDLEVLIVELQGIARNLAVRSAAAKKANATRKAKKEKAEVAAEPDHRQGPPDQGGAEHCEPQQQ